MGIRLACPNGHKLHVKAFLAGKRGICPKCGVTFVIPPTADQETGLGEGASSLDAIEPHPSPAAHGRGTQPEPPPAVAAEVTMPPAQAAPVNADRPGLPQQPDVAVPPSSWNLDRAAKLRYLINRQRYRRSQMLVTIWLLAAVILLAGLLVWVLTRKPAQTSALLPEPRTHLAEISPPPYVAAGEKGVRSLFSGT